MPDDAPADGAPDGRVGVVGARWLVRGREIAFDAVLAFDTDAASLTPVAPDSATPSRQFRYADIDGATAGEFEIALYLAAGNVLDLGVASESATPVVDLTVAMAELTRRVCRLPELTSHLRGFGSQRARPGADHDQFFAPLLDARRASEAFHSPLDQLRAFDPPALRAAAEQTLAGFAAARFPVVAPDRRALEAELVEFADPLWEALDRLARARDAAYSSPDDTRFRRWREWAAAVRGVYAAADRVWVALLPALARSGEPSVGNARLWRRVLRRG